MSIDAFRSPLAGPSFPRLIRFGFAWALVAALFVSGCTDASPTSGDPPGTTEILGVVVNSVEVTLTLFEVEEPEEGTRTVELGVPEGTPVGLSVQGHTALVPMGVVPTATVVDLEGGAVLRTIPLPEGSGATGSIFLTDSTALVANPERNTVSPVNVHSGEAGLEIEVGGYPSAFARVGELVVVVNGELEDFVPAGPGTLTVLDRTTLAIVGEIQLSGENPGAAALGRDGRLYVLNAGRFGQGSGSLSVVDLDLMEEVAHHEGFGDLPGGLAVGSDGRIHVSSWSFGVAVWDPAGEVFVHPPDAAVAPEGVPSAAGRGTDPDGTLYTLSPDCEEPGRVLRLGPDYEVEITVPAGVCPTALAFAEVEREES